MPRSWRLGPEMQRMCVGLMLAVHACERPGALARITRSGGTSSTRRCLLEKSLELGEERRCRGAHQVSALAEVPVGPERDGQKIVVVERSNERDDLVGPDRDFARLARFERFGGALDRGENDPELDSDGGDVERGVGSRVRVHRDPFGVHDEAGHAALGLVDDLAECVLEHGSSSRGYEANAPEVKERFSLCPLGWAAVGQWLGAVVGGSGWGSGWGQWLGAVVGQWLAVSARREVASAKSGLVSVRASR